MKYGFKWILPVALAFLLLASATFGSETLPRLKTSGNHIVDPSGKTIRLKGVNTGNWLVLEMWMLALNSPGIGDQYMMEQKMAERFGEDEKERLMDIYRENYMTPRDFKIIRDFGMNIIRLPFEYEILEDPNTYSTLKPDAWKWLDKAVSMAEQEGLYVIIDMHGAPGRQSMMDHTGRSGYNKLWTEPENQERTVWLWKQIANRYKDRTSVVAFDLLNEAWGSSAEQLAEFNYRLYKEIRPIAKDTIIIFSDFYAGSDAYKDPRDRGCENFMFNAHFYPGFFGNGRPIPYTHKEFLENGIVERKRKHAGMQVPLIIGEFNVVMKSAGGAEMMRRYFDAYNEAGWIATMWSYKVFGSEGGMNGGSWGLVANKNPLPKININSSSKEEMESFFKSLSTMEYVVYDELKTWLTTPSLIPTSLENLPPPPPKMVTAPAHDSVPTPWQSIDIGGSRIGGDKVRTKDSFEIYGGGGDIWGNKDAFRFVYQKIRGNFTITTTVDSMMDVDSFTKAGIMVRGSDDAGATHALINCFPSGGIEFGYRTESGGDMSAKGVGSSTFPGIKLRISRKGGEIKAAFYSITEKTWKELDPVVLPELQEEVLVGLAVCSHDNEQLAKGSFSSIIIEKK